LVTLLAPYLVACTLLVVAGVAKIRSPLNTANGLGQLLPRISQRRAAQVVRAGGVAEMVLGTCGALIPYLAPATLVCLCYFAFSLFIAYLRTRRAPMAGCGCFSSLDAPATRTHLVTDLALAACAGSVAADNSHAWLFTVLSGQPLDGVPLVAASAACTWLVLLTLTSLARLVETRSTLARNVTA
jgi:hypothetical protein